MDRRAWWATVHEITESDTTEVTEHMVHIKKKKDSSGLPGGSVVKRTPADAEVHSTSDPGGFHLP